MPKAGGAADGPSVLFIEGFTRAGDSYVNGLLSQQGAWRGTAIDRITCIGDQQLWPEAMDACRLAIASGALSGWSSRLQISPASSRIFESSPLISDSSVCKTHERKR